MSEALKIKPSLHFHGLASSKSRINGSGTKQVYPGEPHNNVNVLEHPEYNMLIRYFPGNGPDFF